MEAFERIITAINNVVWHPVMLVFITGAAIWFTIRLKGMQFTRFKDMLKYLFEKGENKSDTSLSPFQAFATTVGGRIGTGSVAGTATAIFMGGSGAIFWMWVAALIGASTGMVECMLGQAYKDKNLGELTGGPAYYMTRGIRNRVLGKTLAILFCVCVFIGPGFLLPAMQTQTASTALQDAFGLDAVWAGVIMVVLVGVVILGGIKRIGQVGELLAPFMCIAYFVIALIILVVNIEKVPAVFGSIFASAFGADTMFAGITGAAVSWGIKRGFFSNDAGNGMSPLISAASDTSHPVKQGLVQGFSVYVATLLVCTCTGVSILLAGTYNVAADEIGNVLIVENAPGVMYGVSFMQEAMSSTIGQAGAILLAVMLFLFIYTTQLSYSYQLESTCRFLFGERRGVVLAVRIIFLAFCMFGVLVNGEIIWPMGDIGVGCMLWVNTFAVLLMTPMIIKLVHDYEKQRALGLDPLFDPATVGIEDKHGIWDMYVAKKRERGDYENPASDTARPERSKTMRKIHTPSALEAIGPYSQAVMVNGFLFASGQAALLPENGAVVPGGIEAQAERCCLNLKAVLEAAWLGFDSVVKTTCFLADMADFAAFNSVYERYFTGKPARSCVAVRELPKQVLCEIELIALTA